MQTLRSKSRVYKLRDLINLLVVIPFFIVVILSTDAGSFVEVIKVKIRRNFVV